jgi:MFS family permease
MLVLGWSFGFPVPFILLFAPDWNWIIFANILLGINQGLAWSMTVNMKIDLVGKQRRGLALGLNEFSGYVSVALVGFVTGYIAAIYGLKPYPFFLGIAFALLGLIISWIAVKDTRKFTLLEIKENQEEFTKKVIIKLTVIIVMPLPIKDLETLILYRSSSSVWGVLQLATGSLSDKVGRKILIYPGMIIQGIGIWIVLISANSFIGNIVGMSFLGIGTALVYPTLLAAISDTAHPKWRATSLGVYRFWRDLGFVFGAIGIGFIADLSTNSVAIQLVACIAVASGVFVLFAMKETRKV